MAKLTDEEIKKLNPKKHEKPEFGGLLGAIAITIFLPMLSIFLNLMIRPDYYVFGFFRRFDAYEIKKGLINMIDDGMSLEVWTVYLIWFFGLAILDVRLPGKVIKGTKLRDGIHLSYKINGYPMVILLFSTLALRWRLTNGQIPELQWLYNHYNGLCFVTIAFSFIFATVCFIVSYLPPFLDAHDRNYKIMSLGGNSRYHFANWFLGRELNPRIAILDVKLFCELRPGMLLWLLINLSCLHHTYLKFGTVSDSLVLINLLQGLYILDGVLNEEGLLTMVDITTDGFGFMLIFGDLNFVPFTYALQARYLSLLDPAKTKLGMIQLSILVITASTGYYIFHASNRQKSAFKQGKLSHLNSIPTGKKTNLLCDGWWRKAQHINYFGDWIIAWSWCLTTSNHSVITYYYIFYFAGLLIHRQMRDSTKCRAKYGSAWKKYEETVPYKIVPYVY